MPLVKTDRVNNETCHEKSNLDMRLRFNAAKLLQTDLGAWNACEHIHCAFHQTCLGGPRGTCRRTSGWPLCTQEGKARMSEAKTKWQRNAVYDTETQTERGLRRLESDIRQLDLMMKSQGI